MPAPRSRVAPDIDERRELQFKAEQFLYYEAALLDDGRFEDWLDLFDDDAWYWLPTRADQADPINEISIIYEDLSVLRMRVRRLTHPRAWGLQPQPKTAHVVGNVAVNGPTDDPNVIVVSSMATIAEFRGDDRRLFAGRQTHRLLPDKKTAAGFRIALKRLDLIDADGPLAAMNLPL